MEEIIGQDPNFAAQIDLNCNNCDSRYAPDNEVQIRVLEDRGQTHPQEARATRAFIDQCRRCLTAGKPAGESLAERFSCAYRAGIKGKTGK